jgi:hypothetical protein
MLVPFLISEVAIGLIVAGCKATRTSYETAPYKISV